MEDSLAKFVEEIITTKNLPGINDEVKANLIIEMKERLMDQINRALINAMPDDKIDEFNLLLDQEYKTEDQIQQFVVQSGVDVKTVTAKTMLLFRELYLQTSSQRDNNLNVGA